MSRIGARLLRSALLAIVFLAAAAAGLAHPGGRASDGCHFCRSNCEKWDLEKDERHCHDDGSASSVSDAPATPTAACKRGSGETWRGLVVAPECRCTPYDRDDYPYPQSVEPLIAKRDGMRSPYDGTVFRSLKESDIEHVVSISEAHDSGLCAASANVRRLFARDLDNLALGDAALEPLRKERSRRCRVAAGPEQVLVCPDNHRRTPRVPADHRPSGGQGSASGAGRVWIELRPRRHSVTPSRP